MRIEDLELVTSLLAERTRVINVVRYMSSCQKTIHNLNEHKEPIKLSFGIGLIRLQPHGMEKESTRDDTKEVEWNGDFYKKVIEFIIQDMIKQIKEIEERLEGMNVDMSGKKYHYDHNEFNAEFDLDALS